MAINPLEGKSTYDPDFAENYTCSETPSGGKPFA